VRRALLAFAEDLGTCGVLVAHNVQFDERVVGAEFLRAGWPNPIESKARLCTMRSSAEFCAIPGRGDYKWPTLEELHRALFGAPLASAHDAAADVRSCAKCFFELKRRGILAVPGPPSCPSVKHPSTT
jgi:DNA polymerase III epsilon subunit-like protein